MKKRKFKKIKNRRKSRPGGDGLVARGTLTALDSGEEGRRKEELLKDILGTEGRRNWSRSVSHPYVFQLASWRQGLNRLASGAGAKNSARILGGESLQWRSNTRLLFRTQKIRGGHLSERNTGTGKRDNMHKKEIFQKRPLRNPACSFRNELEPMARFAKEIPHTTSKGDFIDQLTTACTDGEMQA